MAAPTTCRAAPSRPWNCPRRTAPESTSRRSPARLSSLLPEDGADGRRGRLRTDGRRFWKPSAVRRNRAHFETTTENSSTSVSRKCSVCRLRRVISSEKPGILEELGLTRLPHFTALRNSFATILTTRATPRSTRVASTATSPRGTTPNERTTASAR